MHSQLSQEVAPLFSLLLAPDWQHKEPQFKSFMRQLVSDKNSQQALRIIWMKKWSRQVSEKALGGFFMAGYAARDINKLPGGFTIFVFQPVSLHRSMPKKYMWDQVNQRNVLKILSLTMKQSSMTPLKSFTLQILWLTLERKSTPVLVASNSSLTDKAGATTVDFKYGLQIHQKEQRTKGCSRISWEGTHFLDSSPHTFLTRYFKTLQGYSGTSKMLRAPSKDQGAISSTISGMLLTVVNGYEVSSAHPQPLHAKLPYGSAP
jgi:hypothetical protein